jgi:phosphoglycolate phosphatase
MRFDFPDSLIFDMDGTLWDAVETYTLAWNFYFNRHQIDKQLKKIELDALMGLEESKFLEKVLPDFTPKERSIEYQEVKNLNI